METAPGPVARSPSPAMFSGSHTPRRHRILLLTLVTAVVGLLTLFSLLGWYLWRQSVVAEEQRLGALAQGLGQQAEQTILDARQLLESLNEFPATRCSPAHIERMREEAIQRPHIRAIGYWRAVERRCGVGFVQGAALTPPEASRVYENGVVAWWPSEATAIGEVELFLMRLGDHDIAIDPRMLLERQALAEHQAGLWVEDLLLVSVPPGADLPPPGSLAPGLTMDRARGRIVSRFSLDTIFPMDVVAVQPSGEFWRRYAPSLVTAALVGLAMTILWMSFVFRLSLQRLSLVAELRNAIDDGAFRAVYQPVVDLASGDCVGAEALARWTRENGETISPEVFVPMAEEAGMVTDLTLALLATILEDTGELLCANPGLNINFNLSAQDFTNPRLAQGLDEQLRRAGVPATAIKLEITERALLDHEESRQVIRTLRARGHRIAVDDFGTGYSNLSYLQSFELDALKLDKVFVDAIERHTATSGVIVHIIEMAKSLQLEIVAEGIESDHQARWLADNGVRHGQGFLYSRPLSAADFAEFVNLHEGKGPERPAEPRRT